MLKHYLMLLLGVVLIVTSCNKDEDPLINNSGVMTAKVDGSDWTANASEMSASISGGLINISGISADGQLITMTIKATAEGTYPLSEGTSHAMAYRQSTSGTDPAFTSNAIDNNPGKIVITDLNTKDSLISGTFTGPVLRGTDNMEIEISSGIFTDLKYTSGVPDNETGTFLKVDIDGEEWKAPTVSGSTLTDELTIIGVNTSNYKTVNFNLPMDIAIGTYDLGDPFTTYGAQYNINQSTYLVANSGKITVTDHNRTTKEITGTFEFEAEEFGSGSLTASLKNGSFRVKY